MSTRGKLNKNNNPTDSHGKLALVFPPWRWVLGRNRVSLRLCVLPPPHPCYLLYSTGNSRWYVTPWTTEGRRPTVVCTDLVRTHPPSMCPLESVKRTRGSPRTEHLGRKVLGSPDRTETRFSSRRGNSTLSPSSRLVLTVMMRLEPTF